jgi:hypothetical protein
MNRRRNLNMKINLKKTATAALAIALFSGCVSQTPTEIDFGESVRATTSGQIYDMNAALNPETEAVTGGNADRLETVIKTHVSEVPMSQSVQQPISLNINSGGN